MPQNTSQAINAEMEFWSLTIVDLAISALQITYIHSYVLTRSHHIRLSSNQTHAHHHTHHDHQWQKQHLQENSESHHHLLSMLMQFRAHAPDLPGYDGFGRKKRTTTNHRTLERQRTQPFKLFGSQFRNCYTTFSSKFKSQCVPMPVDREWISTISPKNVR